jgi:hypothetical protein
VIQAMVPAHLRQELNGLGAAITIYAVICCIIVALSALWFYELMQPTRIENAGLAAYTPPAATVLQFEPNTRTAEVSLDSPYTASVGKSASQRWALEYRWVLEEYRWNNHF